MNFNLKLFVLSIFFLSLSSQAKILKLQDCIDKALATHPDIQSLVLKLRQNHENIKLEKSIQRPHIELNGEYDPQRTYVLPINGSFNTVDDSGWSIGATVTQRIYDFSKTKHNIKSAKIHHAISKLSLKEAKSLMRYMVRKTYLQLIVQKASIKARQEDLTAKKSFYKQAVALTKAGLKTKADELRILSAMRQSEDALALAKANYQKLLIDLEYLIGERIEANTLFEDSILTNPINYPKKVSQILKNNLQIQIAQKNQKALQERYLSSKAQRLGSIDLVAQLNHFDSLSRYDTAIIGLKYTLPLYQGGKLHAQSQQNKIAAMVAAKEKESKRRSIIQEIKSLLAELSEIPKQINAKKAQLVSAKETKKLIEARYRQGLATYMELLDAQAMILDAQLGLLRAYNQRKEKEFRLEYLNAK